MLRIRSKHYLIIIKLKFKIKATYLNTKINNLTENDKLTFAKT